MSLIDLVADDAARHLLQALEDEPHSYKGVKLKAVTKGDPVMRSRIIQILPSLISQGVIVASRGPVTKNTTVRLGYA